MAKYYHVKTTTLKKEFDRMEQRIPMEMLSMKRLVSYKLDRWNSNQK